MQTVTSHTFGEGGASLPRKTTARGTAYFEAGDGETLILIHGVGMRLEAWAPQIEAFAKTHRVFALDMPGHGASEKSQRAARCGTMLLGLAASWKT